MKKKLLVIAFLSNLAVILFFWLRTALPLFTSADAASVILGFGRLFGLMSAFCVLTQLLLIGRIKWIERVWGHDVLAGFHRKNGKFILYFVTLHFISILSSYSLTSQVNVLQQLLDFFQYYEDTLNSFIAFLLIIGIGLLSIYISKVKLKYEMWYYVHMMMYLAILLAYGHQLKLGGSLSQQLFATYWIGLYIFVIGNFVFFRFVMPVYNLLSFQFIVSRVVPEQGNATSIYITGHNIERFGREAGQFMILRFLDVHRFWQAHPFSLSWGSENAELRVTVKDSGDFTHEISGLKKGTPVLIDGPHGKFSIYKETSQKLLLIAGGIGITPIRSILEEQAGTRDIVFLWSNKAYNDVPLGFEVQTICEKAGIPSFYFYSEETKVKAGDFKGRIDEAALKKLVKNISEREVYLCGPEGFMKAMEIALLSLGVSKKSIHFEVFSFH